MTISEVMSIFDLGGSFSGRLRQTRVFNRESPLIKNNVLSKADGYPYSEQHAYKLDSGFYFMLSRMMNGEAVSIESRDENKNLSNCEDVGYLKTPDYKIDDVMVGEDIKEEVKLFLDAIKNNDLQKSGIFEKVRKGKGNIFLFYGPPGTGKSMLAEAVASYIGKKALVVEYPKITSKLFGETDKQIVKVFDIAKQENVVIIMDEADALLYSRAYAQWEHDIRFVNEMLQALENFEGEMILTTNMDVLLDAAVERRVSLKVKFDLPDPKIRENIWQWHIPDEFDKKAEINFSCLAEKYDFSGGNIKNAVLNAARKASSREDKILTMEDLIFGAELEKKGMFCEKNRPRVVKGFA